MKTFNTPKAEIQRFSINEDILTDSLGDDEWLDDDAGWTSENCLLDG